MPVCHRSILSPINMSTSGPHDLALASTSVLAICRQSRFAEIEVTENPVFREHGVSAERHLSSVDFSTKWSLSVVGE
jgi:hypothetical protein